MSASLVGSEMCIRDRDPMEQERPKGRGRSPNKIAWMEAGKQAGEEGGGCLLYTSDAADDM
eukprot:11596723-Alexandrium_andersonii.AAC.1